jgi:hypothetical protein
MTSNLRYQGKPLLRLLECYVLWMIDALPEKEATALKEMTPKLQSIYRMQGDWQRIVASVMQVPSNMPTLIREMWMKNTKIAQRSDTTLTPQQFAEMFVDQTLMG